MNPIPTDVLRMLEVMSVSQLDQEPDELLRRLQNKTIEISLFCAYLLDTRGDKNSENRNDDH